jgi:CubicO group peptidase (beta-lactamase class C family)
VSVADARKVLLDAIAARVFPAATVEVGATSGPLWRDALGTLTFDDASPAASASTLFDLASLTKPIATTSVALQLVHDGRLGLDDRVASFFPEWRGADRDPVSVRDLLEHSSGLAARLIDPPPGGRREFEHDICTMPLEYAPRTRSIYSDLGFILLGFLLADRGGVSLAALFDEITVRLTASAKATAVRRSVSEGGSFTRRRKADSRYGQSVRLKADTTYDMYLGFGLPPEWRQQAAPTRPEPDDPRRGRMLAGEVHDTYAAALGGAAGHAGLFGTAGAVGAFARAVLAGARGDESVPPPISPALLEIALEKSRVPGSSRALGWDTMLPTSSCGTRMSGRAFGHVGFTGTSLWIDPTRDRYFILLTNRACGGGTLDEMRTVRRAFHDALGDA